MEYPVFFFDKQQGVFYMHFPTYRRPHATTFDGPVMDHWLEQKIAQTANVSAMQDRFALHEDPNIYNRVLYHLSYAPPCDLKLKLHQIDLTVRSQWPQSSLTLWHHNKVTEFPHCDIKLSNSCSLLVLTLTTLIYCGISNELCPKSNTLRFIMFLLE